MNQNSWAIELRLPYCHWKENQYPPDRHSYGKCCAIWSFSTFMLKTAEMDIYITEDSCLQTKIVVLANNLVTTVGIDILIQRMHHMQCI